MLIEAKVLKGSSLHCIEGDFGSVNEFYFDDRYWVVRYLVANSTNWPLSRRVLISPFSLSGIDQMDRKVSVLLSKQQIEDSPSIDTDEPVSRQYEESFNGYYGLPDYWGGPYMWGGTSHIERDPSRWTRPGAGGKPWDRHLRSTNEVTGYHLSAIDGEIGHVDDFIIDDATWSIRYLVVATKNWWPGKKVLISPTWIDNVSWKDREVVASLSREAIKSAPEFTDSSFLTRDYEMSLHRYYNRHGYWAEELTAV